MTAVSLPRLELRYDDLEALQTDYDENLRMGRAFLAGAPALAEREACEVVVVHPESGDTESFPAEAVWVRTEEPGRGVGLVIRDLDAQALARLEALVRGPKREASPESLQLRVRRYTAAQQLRAAREGELAERVALERVHGKAVWEVLLQNPRITVPEVTRIARKGNIPRSVIETIVANPAWLGSGELRRALLSNPRLGGASLDKVLRALPKAELTLASNQLSYSPAVRSAAKKLQGR